MKRQAQKPATHRSKIDPAVRPFLDDVAAIIAARLLAEYRERQRVLGVPDGRAHAR